MKNLLILNALFLILLFSSCGIYRPIYPSTLEFEDKCSSNIPTVEALYRYNVIEERNNKLYLHREKKSDYDFVAFSITNHSPDTIKTENIIITQDGRKVIASTGTHLAKNLKLNPLIPLLLQSPLGAIYPMLRSSGAQAGITNSSGIAVLVLSIITPIATFDRNRKMEKEIKNLTMVGRIIAPGETIYSVVGVPKSNKEPLGIYIIEN